MLKKMGVILGWIVIGAALLDLAVQLYPALADYFQNSQIALTYPYSMDYGEGPLLDQTVRLAKFENIYKNTFDQPPFTISNYPPLFPLLQVPFAWIFGPAFWYGRLISILGALLTALFICLTLHHLTRNWVGAVVGGLFLLASPYIQHWSLFDRIDELALALSWAGIYVVVKTMGAAPNVDTAVDSSKETLGGLARRALKSRSLWLAAMLFVAAIFTRQTYAAAAPFAAFFWLIFGARGSWKSRFMRAVMLGVVVAGVTLVLFLVINLATQGGFYLNIITSNVNKFNWDSVWHYEREIEKNMWPLYRLGAAFLALEALVALTKLAIRLARHLLKKPASTTASQPAAWRPSSWALVLPYALVATAVSVTVGKEGSNVNYLLEVAAALSLMGGAALAYAFQWKRWFIRLPLLLVVIGMLVAQTSLLITLTRKDYTAFLKERVPNQSQVAQVAQIIKDTPGIVLADEYMGLVVLAGKPLYLQPFEYKQMADGKLWDESKLLGEIANHKFDVILWYEPPTWKEAIQSRWTGAQRSMIAIYYSADQKIGNVSVYRPKN